MSKFSQTINYDFVTTLDARGINQLNKELEKTKSLLKDAGQIRNLDKISSALKKSFDPNIGLVNVQKFKHELGDCDNVLTKLDKSLSGLGGQGQRTFLTAASQLAKTNEQLYSTSRLGDKVVNTLGNTVRWGLIAGAFETVRNAVSRANDQIVQLDTSLNNIMIVADKSEAQMRKFAKTANEAAVRLGASTVDFSNAALIFAENGFSEEDYTRLAEITTKTAAVTRQATSETSEQITAMMNGMKLSVDEVEPALDKMALVAAEGASDLGELAEAQQRVASTANMLGVSQDQLISQLSTIISVTRQAPEQVGNSLKTIYARLGDLKLGKTFDEDGITVSLGRVSENLAKVGINILEDNGNMKQMGDVIEELMNKWGSFTAQQKQALAVQLAGKHQYNNLVALLDNQKMYNKQLDLTAHAEGTLNKQLSIHMESIAAKQQQIASEAEGLWDNMVNENAFKIVLDFLRDALHILKEITGAVGGFKSIAPIVAGTIARAGSNRLGEMLATQQRNRRIRATAESNYDQIKKDFEDYEPTERDRKDFADFTRKVQKVHPTLTEESSKIYNDAIDSYKEGINARAAARAKTIKDLNQVAEDNGVESLTEDIKTLNSTIKQFGFDEEGKEVVNKVKEKIVADLTDKSSAAYRHISGQEDVDERSRIFNAAFSEGKKNGAQQNTYDTLGFFLDSDRTGQYTQPVNGIKFNEVSAKVAKRQLGQREFEGVLNDMLATMFEDTAAYESSRSLFKMFAMGKREQKNFTSNVPSVVQKDANTMVDSANQVMRSLLTYTNKQTADILSGKNELATPEEKTDAFAQAITDLKRNSSKTEMDDFYKAVYQFVGAVQSFDEKVRENGYLDEEVLLQRKADVKANGEARVGEVVQNVENALKNGEARSGEGADKRGQGEAMLDALNENADWAARAQTLGSASQVLGGVIGASSALASLADSAQKLDKQGVAPLLGSITGLGGAITSATFGFVQLKTLGVVSGAAATALGAFGIGLTAVLAIFQIWQNYRKEQVEKAEKRSEQAQEQYTNLSSSIEEFQNVGAITADVSKKMKEVGEKFHIVGTESYVATGNLQGFINALKKAQKVALEEKKDASENKLKEYNKWNWFSPNSDLKNSAKFDIDDSKNTNPRLKAKALPLGSHRNFVNSYSLSKQKLSAYQTEVQELQKQEGVAAQKVESATSEEDKQKAEQELKDLRSSIATHQGHIQKLNNVFNDQNVANLKKTWDERMETYAQIDQNERQLSFKNQKAQDVLHTIRQAKGGQIDDYLYNLIDSEKYQFALDNYGHLMDNDTRNNITIEQIKAKTREAGGFKPGVEDELNKFLDKKDISSAYKLQAMAEIDFTKLNNPVDLEARLQQIRRDHILTIDTTIDTAGLQSALDTEQGLDGLISKYNKTEGTGFGLEEAAGLIAKNPEYTQYLTQVGDTYRLNDRAVKAYTDSLDKLQLKMDEARGKHFDDTEFQDLRKKSFDLESKDFEGSGFTAETFGQYTKTFSDLNSQFNSGQINIENFATGVVENFNKITDAIGDSKEAFDKFCESKAGSNAVSMMATEGTKAMEVLIKKFKAGEINGSEMGDTLSDSFSHMTGMLKKLGHLIPASLTDQLDDARAHLENLADVSDFVQKNFDTFAQMFTDAGEVAVKAVDETTGQFKQQYQQTFTEFGSYISSALSDSAFKENFIAELQETGSITQEEATSIANSVAENGHFAASSVVSSTDQAGAAMQALMKTKSDAISAIGAAIASALVIIIDSIKDVQGGVSVTPEFGSPAQQKIELTHDGQVMDTANLTIPQGKITFSGSASGGGKGASAIANYQSYSKAKKEGKNEFTYTDKDGNESSKNVKDDEATVVSELNSYFKDQLKPVSDNLVKSMSGMFGHGSKPAVGKIPQRGKTPGGGGGRRGGGGGGGKKGGGGGAGKDKKPQDPIEYDFDRYAKVNAQLSLIDKKLALIKEKVDRTTGKEYLNNLSAQATLLKQQIPYLKEKLRLQGEEMLEKKKELQGFGISFNSDGTLANYKSVYDSYFNSINSMRQNPGNDEDALKKKEKDFSKLNNAAKKYYELMSSSMLETTKQIEDAKHAVEDLYIETFKRQVDTLNKLKDIQEAYIDFQGVLNHFGDKDNPLRDMEKSMEKLKSYWDVNIDSMQKYYDELIANMKEAEKKAGSAEEKAWYRNRAEMYAKAKSREGLGTGEAGGSGYIDMAMMNLQDMLEQINQFEKTGTASIFGENSKAIYETAQDVYKQAIDTITQYEDEYENLKSAILAGIEKIGEKLDDRLEQFEQIDGRLEHWASLSQLINGEEGSYKQLNEITQAQVANARASIQDIRSAIAAYEELLAKIEATSGKESEQWKAVNQKINEMNDTMLTKVEDVAQKILDNYNRVATQRIKDVFKMSNGDDLDWYAEKWELINKNADQYLDNVNKAYNIQKLQGKYLDMFNKSQDPLVQQRITDQMEQQLGYLRTKTKLSKYDVDYANAQLEILQKRIALEEAERNKSQMKLKRDNQGNFAYEYVANRGDIAKAQEELLDATNNAYNLSKDNIVQTQSDAISAVQTASQSMIDIWTNANLTIEQKQERTKFLVDNLQEYLRGSQEQLSESQKNIINDFIDMAQLTMENAGDDIKGLLEQLQEGQDVSLSIIDERFNDSILNWIMNFTDGTGEINNLGSDLLNFWKDIEQQFRDIGLNITDGILQAGDAIKEAADKTNDLVSSSHDFFEQLKKDSGTLTNYNNGLADMAKKIVDAENNMRAYAEQVKALQNQLKIKERQNQDLTAKLTAAQGGGANGGAAGGSGGGDGSGGWDGSRLDKGKVRQFAELANAGKISTDPYRKGLAWSGYGINKREAIAGQKVINWWYGRQNQGWGAGMSLDAALRKVLGFKTGGYTGNWSGSGNASAGDGKLAWLHQKELVLNSTDTENILKAVESVRAITSQMQQGALDALAKASRSVSSSILTKDQTVDQNVKIEASFPNVHDAKDVETALLGLVNEAAQFAFRQK